MVLLKEKLLEMQRGMEFLTNKESDYVELQQLAEEEAETICELEKENYKLKHALNNIDSKICLEKSKYMELAEYEAETICNLEKENYKLIDSLNTAEETIKNERKNNKALMETLKVNYSLNIAKLSSSLQLHWQLNLVSFIITVPVVRPDPATRKSIKTASDCNHLC